MEFFLGLVEPADHENIYFIVLANIIFSFTNSLYKFLLELLVALLRSECVLGKTELHEGLIEQDAGKEVKLLFTYAA